jgi:hypothetical protein
MWRCLASVLAVVACFAVFVAGANNGLRLPSLFGFPLPPGALNPPPSSVRFDRSRQRHCVGEDAAGRRSRCSGSRVVLFPRPPLCGTSLAPNVAPPLAVAPRGRPHTHTRRVPHPTALLQEPPVGKLRWQPPVPKASWGPDVLDASAFGLSPTPCLLCARVLALSLSLSHTYTRSVSFNGHAGTVACSREVGAIRTRIASRSTSSRPRMPPLVLTRPCAFSAYGYHVRPRCSLTLFVALAGGTGAQLLPVILFVHGGAFVNGKRLASSGISSHTTSVRCVCFPIA